jgi:hypothetical protein
VRSSRRERVPGVKERVARLRELAARLRKVADSFQGEERETLLASADMLERQADELER